MPARNGTGPWGFGPMTGRGLGRCGRGYAFFESRTGRSRGHGYGFRNAGYYSRNMTDKEILLERKEMLEQQLEDIEKQLVYL